jgi:aspartate aminotransferase
MHPSSRVEELQTPIRKIAEIISGKENAIRFDIGQPDFDTPKHIKKAAKKALDKGLTGYSPMRGIDELREAIAEYESRKGFTVTKDNIIVTTGGSGALMTAFLGLLDHNEPVVLPEPYWEAYPLMIRVANGKPMPLKYFEAGKLILKKPESKVMVINSPSNPDGAVYSENQIKALAEYAKNHGLTVISDEVYDNIIYDAEHHSIRKYYDNVITINSFSKTYSMTGWRLGWLVADEKLINYLAKINRAMCAGPNTFIQYGALAALKGKQDFILKMLKELRGRRDLMKKKIDEIGWECELPQGAFYMFPRIGRDAWKYCLDLIDKQKVSMVPGDAFGKKEHVRLCFGSANREQIKEGFERILKYQQ